MRQLGFPECCNDIPFGLGRQHLVPVQNVDENLCFPSLQPMLKGQFENAVPKQGEGKVSILDGAFIYDRISKKKAVFFDL